MYSLMCCWLYTKNDATMSYNSQQQEYLAKRELAFIILCTYKNFIGKIRHESSACRPNASTISPLWIQIALFSKIGAEGRIYYKNTFNILKCVRHIFVEENKNKIILPPFEWTEDLICVFAIRYFVMDTRIMDELGSFTVGALCDCES
jgi:hypothetical protein